MDRHELYRHADTCPVCAHYACQGTISVPLENVSEDVLSQMGWITSEEASERWEIYCPSNLLAKINLQVLYFYFWLKHRAEIHGITFSPQRYCEYQMTKIRVALIEAGYFPGTGKKDLEMLAYESVVPKQPPVLKISDTPYYLTPIDGNAASIMSSMT